MWSGVQVRGAACSRVEIEEKEVAVQTDEASQRPLLFPSSFSLSTSRGPWSWPASEMEPAALCKAVLVTVHTGHVCAWS